MNGSAEVFVAFGGSPVRVMLSVADRTADLEWRDAIRIGAALIHVAGGHAAASGVSRALFDSVLAEIFPEYPDTDWASDDSHSSRGIR